MNCEKGVCNQDRKGFQELLFPPGVEVEKLFQKPRPSSKGEEAEGAGGALGAGFTRWQMPHISALAATWSWLLSGVSRALRWKTLESRPGPGRLALDCVPPRQGRCNGPKMTSRGWRYLSAVPSLSQVLLSFQTSIQRMKPGRCQTTGDFMHP